MRNQAAYSDLAKIFNRITDVRTDVRSVLESGVTEKEREVLQVVHAALGNDRLSVEYLIDEHPRRKAS